MDPEKPALLRTRQLRELLESGRGRLGGRSASRSDGSAPCRSSWRRIRRSRARNRAPARRDWGCSRPPRSRTRPPSDAPRASARGSQDFRAVDGQPRLRGIEPVTGPHARLRVNAGRQGPNEVAAPVPQHDGQRGVRSWFPPIPRSNRRVSMTTIRRFWGGGGLSRSRRGSPRQEQASTATSGTRRTRRRFRTGCTTRGRSLPAVGRGLRDSREARPGSTSSRSPARRS